MRPYIAIVLSSCFILTCIQSPVFSQRFKSAIYFKDALSNYDTVFIGLDQRATKGADSLFNEIDETQTPWKGTFETRVVIVDRDKLDCGPNEARFTPNLIKYMSHSNIISDNLAWNDVIGIAINKSELPVEVSWDSDLFKDTLVRGSIITDWHPGSWFDVGCFNLNEPYYTFDIHNHFTIESPTAVTYVDEAENELFFLFFSLFPEDIFVSNHDYSNNPQASIYPNPVIGGQFTIEHSDHDEIHYQIIDYRGNIVGESQFLNSSYVVNHSLPSGIYYVSLTSKTSSILMPLVIVNQ